MTTKEINKAILEVKAIQFARLCSAQENPKNPIVNIDDRANEAIEILIKYIEHTLKNGLALGEEEIIKILAENSFRSMEKNFHRKYAKAIYSAQGKGGK